MILYITSMSGVRFKTSLAMAVTAGNGAVARMTLSELREEAAVLPTAYDRACKSKSASSNVSLTLPPQLLLLQSLPSSCCPCWLAPPANASQLQVEGLG
jgi:hypothetical protein